MDTPRYRTKEEPIIPHTHHNKIMVISLITSTMGMLCKGIISQIPDLWQDSPRCLHQCRWWLLNQWDSRVIMWEGQDPSKRGSNLILSLWPTHNCTLNWFRVAYYHRLISHHYNHHTPDGITRMSTVIIIQAIKDTLRKTTQRWNEMSKTSSKKGS